MKECPMRAIWISVVVVAAAQSACSKDVQEKLQRSRMSANEASAIGTLRAIVSGEMVYAASCANGGFAVSLPDLAKPPKDAQSFVSSDLAAGATISKSGYRITLTRNAAPDVTTMGAATQTCNGSANPPASSFFASAEPERPGETGERYFAVDAQAIVYASTSAIANPIVPSATVKPLE
jgi:hypothetical protein